MRRSLKTEPRAEEGSTADALISQVDAHGLRTTTLQASSVNSVMKAPPMPQKGPIFRQPIVGQTA